MKKIFIVISTILLVACGLNNDQNADGTENVEVTITKHGENINEEGAITVAEFLSQFAGKDSLSTKLMATISEVCSKKGCWMMLNLGNDLSMRVSFKDYGFFVPMDAEGKLAYVQGVARMDTTSIDELKHFLSDANASQEEIDAVTEPEYNYSFEAVGVIIKEEKLTGGEEVKH